MFARGTTGGHLVEKRIARLPRPAETLLKQPVRSARGGVGNVGRGVQRDEHPSLDRLARIRPVEDIDEAGVIRGLARAGVELALELMEMDLEPHVDLVARHVDGHLPALAAHYPALVIGRRSSETQMPVHPRTSQST